MIHSSKNKNQNQNQNQHRVDRLRVLRSCYRRPVCSHSWALTPTYCTTCSTISRYPKIQRQSLCRDRWKNISLWLFYKAVLENLFSFGVFLYSCNVISQTRSERLHKLMLELVSRLVRVCACLCVCVWSFQNTNQKRYLIFFLLYFMSTSMCCYCYCCCRRNRAHCSFSIQLNGSIARLGHSWFELEIDFNKLCFFFS